MSKHCVLLLIINDASVLPWVSSVCVYLDLEGSHGQGAAAFLGHQPHACRRESGARPCEDAAGVPAIAMHFEP